MCYSRTPATWRARGGRTRVARAVGTRGLEPERQDQNLQCCRLHHRPSGACCGRSVCTLARGAVRCLEPAVRRELTASSAPGKRSATELLGLNRCVVVTCGGGPLGPPSRMVGTVRSSLGGQDSNPDCEDQDLECCRYTTPDQGALGREHRLLSSWKRPGSDRRPPACKGTGDLLLAKEARLPG